MKNLFLLLILSVLSMGSGIYQPPISLPPSGTAGGDLSGTYPNPAVANINGVPLGDTAALPGNILVGDGTQWVTHLASGDVYITSTGGVTIEKIQGIPVGLIVPNVVIAGYYLNGTVTSISLSGTVATVTETSHPFSTGDYVVFSGITGVTSLNNVIWGLVTKTGTNTYTFPCSLTGTPAGTIKAMLYLNGQRSYNIGSAGLVKSVTRSSTGEFVWTLTNTQSDTFYGVDGTGASTTASVAVYFALPPNAITTTTVSVQFIGTPSGVITAEDPTAYMQINLTGII